MNLEPRRPSEALTFGTMFHEILAIYYRNNDPDGLVEQYIDHAADMFDDKLARSMYYNYKEYAKVNDDIKEITGIEQKFSTPLYVPDRSLYHIHPPFDAVGKHNLLMFENKPIEYVGVVDLVYINNKEELCILDHKTTSTLFSISNRTYIHAHTQLPTYAWALNSMGYKVDKIIYQEFLKEIPSKLKRLKRPQKGRNYSIDVRQRVTLKAALTTLVNAGENITNPDYIKFLTALGKKGERFVQRTSVPTSRFDFDEISEKILHIVLELLHPLTVRYKNNSIAKCMGCPYRVPCFAPVGKREILDELFQQRTPYASLI